MVHGVAWQKGESEEYEINFLLLTPTSVSVHSEPTQTVSLFVLLKWKGNVSQ